MTDLPTDTLIDRLAAEVRPVRPLRAPGLRAFLALAALALAAGLAIALFGDVADLRRRYAGREALLAFETMAMLATAALAIVAAFFRAVPGRSPWWVIAPLPALALWLLLSGLGCYDDFLRRGVDYEVGESLHCLSFILASSAIIAPLLIWRVARARPIDPLPVALLLALGSAAASAFILIFFHPFAVTFVDLGVHLSAMLVVAGVIGILNRRALKPA